MDNINKLPDEILKKILGVLPIRDKIRSGRVCKRWQKLMKQGLITHVAVSDLTDVNGILNWKVFEKILAKAGSSLVWIDLTGVQQRSMRKQQSLLATVTKKCQNIRVLKTEFLTANKDLISSLKICKKLDHLALRHCTDLKDTHIITLIDKYKLPLTCLDVTGCEEVTGMFLCFEDKKGVVVHQLKTMYFDGCSKLVELKDLKNCSLQSISVDKSTSPHIKSLLMKCQNSLQYLMLKKSGVLSFAELCLFKKLKSLTLQTAKFKDFDGFSDFTKTAVNLTELCIDSSSYEWSGWDHKAHNQEELMLDLAKMKNLTTLQVRDMPCISNINLTSWAEHLKSLRNLQCLSLTRISDDGALSVLTRCSKLQVFSLRNCERITEVTLKQADRIALSRFDMPPLVLNLSGTKVTSEQVKACASTSSGRLQVILE